MKHIINVVGMGPGCVKLLTRQAEEMIYESDVLLGPSRLVESVQPLTHKESLKIACKLTEMKMYIEKYASKCKISILASGDTGFYSVANWLQKEFGEAFGVRCIPGISSMQYFCSKLQKSYEKIHTISVHGRENLVLGEVLTHETVFVLTGGTYKVQDVCQLLVNCGLGEVKVSVGEHLSYPHERIKLGKALDFAKESFDDLAVMLIERENRPISSKVTHGLSDELFIRGKVPMTKEEVRTVCLSKMALCESDILYDIGAGTGSVAIEMARMCPRGYVYALEKKKEAVALIKANQEKFGIYNMEVIEAKCPEGMEALPPADKVFIGGSSGELESILAVVLAKNPLVTIVVTAITLETLREVLNCAKLYQLETTYTQMSVANSKNIGDYHMMIGQNPIFIMTMKGKVYE